MIEISKIIRSKRRSIALIVERDGSLVVRAPLQASDETIRRLVETKADWIRLTQEKARKLGPAPVRKKFVAGEEFWYLGQRYPLEFVKGRQTALYLDGSFKMSPATRPKARLAFESWYKRQAKVHIPRARAASWQRNMDMSTSRSGSPRRAHAGGLAARAARSASPGGW